MKKSLLTLTALTLTALLCLGGADLSLAPVQAAPSSTAPSSAQRAGRAAIQAAYDKRGQALIRRDVETMMSFYAPDFQGYSYQGAVSNRAETEAMLRRGLGLVDKINVAMGVSTRFIKHDGRILSLTWHGKDAIVMSQTTSVSLSKKGGRTVRSETVELCRDYWTPTAQGWKMRQSAQRQIKAWIDGQRMA